MLQKQIRMISYSVPCIYLASQFGWKGQDIHTEQAITASSC